MDSRTAFGAIDRLADFPRISNAVLRREPVRVAGLGGAAKALFIAASWRVFRRPIVVVTSETVRADTLAADIAYFQQVLNPRSAAAVCAFPAWDVDPYSGLSPHADVQQARAVALWKIRASQAGIIVTSARALASRIPSPDVFDTYVLKLAVHDDVSEELMLEHLVTAGYVAAEPVTSVGEFSRRGGIVDVYSPLMPNPARIEFFGDSIESIRQFDPDDQRSTAPLERVEILPMREQLVTREAMRDWTATARRKWEEDRYRDSLGEKLIFGSDGIAFEGWEFLLPLGVPRIAGLVDYLDDAVFMLDEPETFRKEFAEFHAALADRFGQSDDAGVVALAPELTIRSPGQLDQTLESYPSLALEELGGGEHEFLILGQPSQRFHGRFREMVDSIRRSWEGGVQTIVLGGTTGMAERFAEIFKEYDLPYRAEFRDREPGRRDGDSRVPIVAVGHLSGGFRLPEAAVEVFAESDLLDESEHSAPRSRRRTKSRAFLSSLDDLKPGAFVVHVDHGIGQYEGIATVHGRECMVLSYHAGDKLYVPLERVDLVQRYSATDGAQARLDKLGGTTWVQRKARVRRAIRDMAEELLRLYAERKVAVGHAFPPDTEWQREFEEAFPYEETEDQTSAIADIKADMQAEVPMDRLVCGDVGYGKTEVAMRAVFKAVGDGKQVAILAPTTVLSFQHYETLKERFAAFPITIRMLSRFVPAKEQKKVVAGIGTGQIDVVVGTHRILSKDVEFHDLGLLVVDEEQRFGVSHKERLKQIRKQVDVLTMTATPIPRTLHMALTGLRDMSVIETPPRDRLAIQTSVLKFNPLVIENAINYELDRGGQVYFVHNRVGSIYSMAHYVQKICPRARVAVGHGQMTERELEKVMLAFMHHEFDVLVATTIIENGLDIPLANTMLVNRADRYGLSQLYQLRGRVGRSNRRAYAYLLIPSDKTLTPIARRRLAAIREFSELGAGFRIAALDLELRGAGNLLGGEQHGHIEAIGFDLYCQMLERTMEELRTGESAPDVETTINLQADLRIPPDFIDDEALRLRIYKGIASCRTEEEIAERYRDLEDRLGSLPGPVENLLEYARLRVLGRSLGVRSIDRKRSDVDIVFDPNARVDPERIVQIVERRGEVGFMPPATLRIEGAGAGRDLLAMIQDVLRDLS